MKSADSVLKNGKVYTVDANRSWAEALAIKDKRIIYVGDNETVDRYINVETRVIDLDGKMVLPGFIDSHAHPSFGVVLTGMAKLNNLPSVQAYLEEIKNFAANRPNEAAIYGNGWDNCFFPAIGPLKEDLDAAITDRPASMFSEDGHAIWVNSKAIEYCGITKDTPDPPGGVIERSPETGEPSGTFRENAMDLIHNVLPPISLEQMKAGILAYANLAASEGVTTVHEAMLMMNEMEGTVLGFGGYRCNTDAFAQLVAENGLNLRVRGSLYIIPDKGVSQIDRILSECARHKNPLFQIRSAKVFVDGVLEGHTAYLLEPYEHNPDYYGEVLYTPESLNEMFEAIDRAKLQIHVHAIGDAGISMALDAYAHAIKANGRRDARHQVTHIQIVTPPDFKRFADMDIIGVPQPMWFKKGAYFEELAVPYLGKDRAEREYPMKSFLDAGVRLASASDFPVSMPCPPLLGIHGGVTRCEPGVDDPDEILWPEERVSLDEMIAGYTINGAYANFLENETGSIEVGKKADLVILEKNLFEIPPEKISEVKIMMTFFEGKEVFCNTSFE